MPLAFLGKSARHVCGGNLEKIQFSFADGGAFLARLRKHGVLSHKRSYLSHRILLAFLITWFPLLILSALRGVALGTKVRIPFLFDLIQHARFLVALPIALWAETYISPKFESVLNRFIDANLVSDGEISRFGKAISRANSLKGSVVAEILIFVLAYLYISLGLHRAVPPELTIWNQSEKFSGSLMLLWYLWVSLPVFTFVWLRWVWRTLIWAYLLFRISRLKLRLTATHPDHAGGLAFVSVGQRRFAVLVLATSALVSASIAEEILFSGASLRSYEPELTAFFLVCILVVMGPLLVFTPLMIQAKLRDWGKYGVLAAEYTQAFDNKWIQGKNPAHDALLGSSDIQSLADLKNSYEGISQMRVLLPDRQTIVVLLIAYILPLVPLLATVIPLRQILSEMLKLLMK
jgi:hypothetical protein